MRFRQVHLDFHTSEHIPKIGSRFQRKQFQKTLQQGHIDSITIFAKCHHGWSYHPTKVGRIHPHLNFDLLGEMMEACREIDVLTPVYVSAGLDEYYLREIDPGHACVAKEGNNPLRAGFQRICFNTPYLDYLLRQIEEVVKRYPTAYGLFLDIVGVRPCYCQHCINELLERGMDPTDDSHVLQLAREVQRRYFKASQEAVGKIDPKMRLFQNAGHVHKGDRWFNDFVSHIELESLPTGGWGYDHFPLSARYAATQKHEYLGMTGKFHTSWGEFGGFKHDNALRYECASMVANGARCSIGDQLHPNGRMNPDTYRKIGLAYREVEAKEPFCRDAKPVSEIAILSIESIAARGSLDAHRAERNQSGDVGASRMLLERQIMFDVIDADEAFEKYKLIIVPDNGRMDAALGRKLKQFTSRGGKLVLSYESGMKADKSILDSRLVSEPTVIWGDAVLLKSSAKSQALIHRYDPYFNRSVQKFCSHRHAPDQKKSPYPAAVQKGNILYFAHSIFRHYNDRGQMLYRDMVVSCLRRLLQSSFNVETTMPSCGRLTLMEQPSESRFVLHLLYAVPIQRGGNVSRGDNWGPSVLQVIEDVIPLPEVRCQLRLPRRIKSANLALSGQALEFTQSKGSAKGEYAIEFTVPKVDLHEMVLLDY